MNTQVLYNTTGVSFISVELISRLEGMVRYVYCSLKAYFLKVKLIKNMFNLLFLLKNVLTHTHTQRILILFKKRLVSRRGELCALRASVMSLWFIDSVWQRLKLILEQRLFVSKLL